MKTKNIVESLPVNAKEARGMIQRATRHLIATRPGCSAPLCYLYNNPEAYTARQACEILCVIDKLLEWARP